MRRTRSLTIEPTKREPASDAHITYARHIIADCPVEKLLQRYRFLQPGQGRDRPRVVELHQIQATGVAIAPWHRAAQHESLLFPHAPSPGDRRARCRHWKEAPLVFETRGSRSHLPAADRDRSNRRPQAARGLLQQPSIGPAKQRIL